MSFFDAFAFFIRVPNNKLGFHEKSINAEQRVCFRKENGMKIFFKNKSLHILFVIFLITQTSTAEATDEVTFSGGAPLDEYQPRLIVPILTEAFKRNGIRFHAKYHPSLRSLQYSNSGKMDGELHRVHEFHEVSSGKYPNLMRIESKLLSVWLAAFATKSVKIEIWDDLKEYNVIYYRGRKNVELFLNKVLPPEKIYAVTTDEQAFRMLAASRTDMVISESRQGNKIIANNPKLSDIVEIAKLDETKIYAYIHKKHRDIAPIIAGAIEEMKWDGTFSMIVDDVNKAFR